MQNSNEKLKCMNEVIVQNNKIQCLICKKWFRQVGSHVVQKHDMTCRQYREEYNLEVKKGLLPPDLRELKAKQCKENHTIDNLKKGAKYRFIKNDVRAGKYSRSPITLKRLSLGIRNKHESN